MVKSENNARAKLEGKHFTFWNDYLLQFSESNKNSREKIYCFLFVQFRFNKFLFCCCVATNIESFFLLPNHPLFEFDFM